MVDFAKMRDPAWQAEFRNKEAARQAEQEQKDKALRELVNLGLAHVETLPADERSLVRSCHQKLNTTGLLSDKQEAWLRDIARRFSSTPDQAP